MPTEGEIWWRKMTVKARVRTIGNGEAFLFAVQILPDVPGGVLRKAQGESFEVAAVTSP